MRAGGHAWARYVVTAREAADGFASPRAVLERELGLLSYEALAAAERELEQWHGRGYRLLTPWMPDYPANLVVIDSRPPLLFVDGDLAERDRDCVAVIGTRTPGRAGLELARELACSLARAGFTVASGLAAGIDAEVHRSVLGLAASHGPGAGAAGRPPRTIAVIGSGLDHAYPAQHAGLQRQIARDGAVISQLWPEARPTRRSFPARNALMAGVTLGSVIVEASEHSGTRVQARHALAQGRAVVLMAPTLVNTWARALAGQPGVFLADDANAATDIFKRRTPA